MVTVIPPKKHLNNSKFFPLAGISNTETVYCNELGFYPIYKSDRYGFNNLDNLWDEKIDYVLMGDSMVTELAWKINLILLAIYQN